MKEAFKQYMINNGYTQYTPKGLPSTVYDYLKRINFVCAQENKTWLQLAEKIDLIVIKYDVGGTEEYLGNKSHRAVINALKRYQEFCHSEGI